MSWITAISILALCAGALLIGSGLSQHFRKGDDRIRRRLLEPDTHGDEGGMPVETMWRPDDDVAVLDGERRATGGMGR